jgi:CheY-like chemotaxis protein
MAGTEDSERPGREAGAGTWLNVSPYDLNSLIHELRNPLGPIHNATELLRARCIDERQSLCLDILTRQIARLTRTLDELTDIVSAPQRELRLRKQSVNLADVVGSALRGIRPAIDRARQRLVVTLPDLPVTMVCDPLRLAQVLQALVQHATGQTPQGRSISLRAERTPTELLIEVHHDATGMIAPGHSEQPFARAADSTHDDDLALAAARDIVELHGGTIEARGDEAGRGCQFTVRLPMLGEPSVQAPAGAHNNSRPRRIMVIDDHEDSASSLCEVFAAGGHSVLAARTGEIGLALAERFRPEAVVIDLGLPGIDGFEVGRRLHEAEATARALLIALTGFSFKQFRDLSAYSVFRHYLLKPASPDTLMQVIENTLDDTDTCVR